MTTRKPFLGSYTFPLILMLSISAGGFVGINFPLFAKGLKPFGDLFLNLILTTIVPLIFFSIASAVARAGSLGQLGKLFSVMGIIFILTSVLASCFAIFFVKAFPPIPDIHLALTMPDHPPVSGLLNKVPEIFTVTEFSELLSHRHMLALIVFSILIGMAASSSIQTQEDVFISLLKSGETIFMRVFSFIMVLAPLGFFSYFAVLVSELGANLIQHYVHVSLLYYATGLLYFILAYTGYAYLSGKMNGIQLFWKNITLPMFTSIATCSSAASIPANLIATRQMQVPVEIFESVIPIGTILHKEGSVIGGIVKIAFLFSVFHLDFSGASVLFKAVGVSLLVGTVMGAIPSGGMLGELLILNVYGFPPSALIAIAAISIIIDPLATMLNVTGNSISSMLIARVLRADIPRH